MRELEPSILSLNLQSTAISPELKDLIDKMLVKDPTERITLPEIKAGLPICDLLSGKFKIMSIPGPPLGHVPRRVPARLRGGELRRAGGSHRH